MFGLIPGGGLTGWLRAEEWRVWLVNVSSLEAGSIGR